MKLWSGGGDFILIKSENGNMRELPWPAHTMIDRHVNVQLCNTVDCSPPGSYVHGVSQARILKWVAISSSRDLPDSGIEPVSPAWQVDSLPLSHLGNSYKF